MKIMDYKNVRKVYAERGLSAVDTFLIIPKNAPGISAFIKRMEEKVAINVISPNADHVFYVISEGYNGRYGYYIADEGDMLRFATTVSWFRNNVLSIDGYNKNNGNNVWCMSPKSIKFEKMEKKDDEKPDNASVVLFPAEETGMIEAITSMWNIIEYGDYKSEENICVIYNEKGLMIRT